MYGGQINYKKKLKKGKFLKLYSHFQKKASQMNSYNNAILCSNLLLLCECYCIIFMGWCKNLFLGELTGYYIIKSHT